SGALLLLKMRQCLGLERDVFRLGKTVFLRSISCLEMRSAKFELRVQDSADLRTAALHMPNDGSDTPILEAVLPDASVSPAAVQVSAGSERLEAAAFYAERGRLGSEYGEAHRVLTQLS